MWLTKEGMGKMKEQYDRWGPKTREFIDWFFNEGVESIHMTLHLEMWRDRKLIKELFGLDVEKDMGPPPKYGTVEEAFEDIFREFLEIQNSPSEPIDWDEFDGPCDDPNHLICKMLNAPTSENDPSAQGKTKEQKEKFGV